MCLLLLSSFVVIVYDHLSRCLFNVEMAALTLVAVLLVTSLFTTSTACPRTDKKTIGHGDEALRENTLNLLLSFSLGLYWLMSFLKQKIGLTMSLWPVRNFKPSSHVSDNWCLGTSGAHVGMSGAARARRATFVLFCFCAARARRAVRNRTP